MSLPFFSDLSNNHTVEFRECSEINFRNPKFFVWVLEFPFCGSYIWWVVNPKYTPSECTLSIGMQQYEESGDPDIADNLIESLNAARRDRWEESTSQLNFTLKQEKLVPHQTPWCRSTPSASFSAASVSQRCRQPSSSSCQSSKGSET